MRRRARCTSSRRPASSFGSSTSALRGRLRPQMSPSRPAACVPTARTTGSSSEESTTDPIRTRTTGRSSSCRSGRPATLRPSSTPRVIDQLAPKTNDTLTVTATAHDPEGDPITLRYEWRLDGVQIPGQTASTLDLSLAGNGDKGDAISVRVAAFDGISEGAPRTSAQVSIENTAPVFGANLPNRTDLEGAAVSVSAGATDADGDPLTYEATGLPAGITLNATNGLLSGTIATGAASASPYNVSISVREGAIADAVDSFTWTVNVSPGAPGPLTGWGGRSRGQRGNDHGQRADHPRPRRPRPPSPSTTRRRMVLPGPRATTRRRAAP